MIHRGDEEIDHSSSKAKGPVVAKFLRIVAVVLLYWFISITLVFINKSLLSSGASGKNNLNMPFFIAWFQCLVSVVGCYSAHIVATIFSLNNNLTNLDFSLRRCTKVFPLSLIFVAMIAFNNLFLLHVGVSFYYVGRSLSTVFNVVLTYLLMGQKTSMGAMISCGVIIVGFFLGVDQEGNDGTLTTIGFLFGVLGSLFVSLNAIYTKKILSIVDDNLWQLTMYNNVNAMILFMPLIWLNFEMQSLFSSIVVKTGIFWLEMVVAGCFGLGIGYVTGLQIQVTSPLTHNISGTAKAAAQTVLSTIIYEENKSFWWWVSNIVVLAGSMAYTWVKTFEMARL